MHSVGQGSAAGSAGTRPWRRVYRWTLLILVLAVLLFAGGFWWFVRQMPVVEAAPSRNADGIVVLTGGALRISDALELLASGHGQRLLISGVNRMTRPYEIARLVPEHQRWFSCCVDLDHSATNTIGNAIETRRWVEERRFKSLIVVTANYHMPRAMAELEHELPGVALVPYAVVSDRIRIENWWDNPSTARLLILEYLKYIVARSRMVLPHSVA
ncbi:MAG: YdcF family protein [Xanthobacteraceae bacterium]|nr:YdcF family protein [Xanthobacteraceae bacterium]